MHQWPQFNAVACEIIGKRVHIIIDRSLDLRSWPAPAAQLLPPRRWGGGTVEHYFVRKQLLTSIKAAQDLVFMSVHDIEIDLYIYIYKDV